MCGQCTGQALTLLEKQNDDRRRDGQYLSNVYFFRFIMPSLSRFYESQFNFPATASRFSLSVSLTLEGAFARGGFATPVTSCKLAHVVSLKTVIFGSRAPFVMIKEGKKINKFAPKARARTRTSEKQRSNLKVDDARRDRERNAMTADGKILSYLPSVFTYFPPI